MKKTGIIVGLIVLLGLGGIAGGYYYFVQRPNITVGDDGIIFIQPGDSFETVMTTLISSGYVKNEYTLRKLAELKKYPSDSIYIIGGESVYRQLLDECDVAHITKIDYEYESDAYFPNLDENPEWEITADSDEQTYFDLEYYFYKYEKRRRV